MPSDAVIEPGARRPRPARSTWLAIGLAIAVVALLLAVVGADPAPGVTGSRSPFTDEAWNVLNARNFELLGTWSTDQFNLHLVNAPFSLLEAAIFRIVGVGMIQARVLSVFAVAMTVLVLAFGLTRAFGRGPALLAAAAFGTSVLVLYYGHLAYPENLGMLATTSGLLLIGRVEESKPRQAATAAGPPRPRVSMAARGGLMAGLLFGVAIATKANFAFGIAGSLAAIAIIDARRGTATVSWLFGVVGGLTAVAVTWVVLVLVPAHDRVAVDLAIWPHQLAPESLVALVRRIVSYPFSNDGGLRALAPVAIGAVAGIGATIVAWRTLSNTARRLAVAAIGSLVVELAVLLVASYRPNRYLLPLLPAAAILVGVAARVSADALVRREAITAGRRRLLRWTVSAVAVAALAGPGVLSVFGWAGSATHRLEPMQKAVAAIVPSGATVWGGYAPLVGMTARVKTIVPWPPASANLGRPNPGGASWIVTGTHEPTWVDRSSASWAERRERICFEWGGADVCLVELP